MGGAPSEIVARRAGKPVCELSEVERHPLPRAPHSLLSGRLGQASTPPMGAAGGRVAGGQGRTVVRRGQGDQCIVNRAPREPNPARELGQPAGGPSALGERRRANRWASSTDV